MMQDNKQPSPYFIRRTAQPGNEPAQIQNIATADDQVHPLRDYWVLIRRHRWLILSCTLVVFIAAALYTFTRTRLYTAEVTLLIERKAPQILKVEDARAELVDSNNEFYKTQYEILKSRALAERVIRDHGLHDRPLFGGTMSDAREDGFISGLWKQLRETATAVMRPTAIPAGIDPVPVSTRLAAEYLSMLQVRPVAGTSLVTVKFTTPDPVLSARVANAHASSYVRYGIDLRSQTNTEASEFLEQKLTELKERVEQSEAALNSYRKEKGIISVDDKSNVTVERLLDLNKALTAAEAERIAWEAQLRSARGRNAEEVPGVRNSVLIGMLKAELTKLEAEYASLAKEFTSNYPPLANIKARMNETERRLNDEIAREVNSIEAGYAAALSKELDLRAAMDKQKAATLSLKDSAVQYAILAREVDTNKQLYDGVLQRLKEIGVAGEVRTSNIYVMGNAVPPLFPSYPDRRRTLLIGLLLGLSAGIGLAFLLEQLDNTLKSPEEAERYFGAPSLAMVPDFRRLNGRNYGYGYVSRLMQMVQGESPANANGAKNTASQVVLNYHPLSLIAEAYRTLRSALMLSQAGGPPHTVLITSATRGEGKTTTLVNTAIVFAHLRVPVLIVDGDLRRPNCHRLLKMDNAPGLAELLAGQIGLEEAIQPTAAEYLFFVSAGALPPNPAELLGSQRMHELLELLRERFEFIFVDSSPLLAVSDAIFLSTMVDGTLIVANRETTRPLVRKARERLNASHTRLLGVLLNRVDIHNAEYGIYYQQYYQYHHSEKWPGSNGDPRGPVKNNGTANGSDAMLPEVDGWSVGKTQRSGPVAPEMLQLLRHRLTLAMGPMALMVLRDHANALGESLECFPSERLEELVKRVSEEVLDAYHRSRFEQEMMQELGKLF